MDLLFLLLLFVISPSFLTVFLILLINSFGYICILFLFLFILSFGVGYFGFKILILKTHHKMKKPQLSFSKYISAQYSKGNLDIVFVKENNWISYINNETVPFVLNGIVFKKSFLVAFFTRAIRFQVISNAMPIGFIWHYKMKGFDETLKTKIIFKSGKKVVIRPLLESGVSKYGFMPWLMTMTSFPEIQKHGPGLLYRKKLLKQKMPIDEKEFQIKFM